MNIEIANRLIELRKKNGLSQEELADRLGISRQAVSKWERAESSPDTDNLICLAKLYNVSLDDLLDTDQSIDDIRRDVKEKEDPFKENLTKDIQTLKDDIKNEVEQRKESRYAHLSEKEKKRAKAFDIFECIFTGALFLIAVIVYLWMSFKDPYQWGRLWIVFFAPPIISSLINSVKNRRFTQFAFPIAAVMLYLGLGLYMHIWHPTWLIFVMIPVFYTVFEPIDKLIAKSRNEPMDPEDDDPSDD